MKTLLFFSAILLLPPSSIFAAATVELSTAESPFNPGVFNQGWYSPSVASSPTTDNYATGYFFGNDAETRGFLTFDLSGVSGNVIAARLKIRAAESDSPDGEETLDVHAVDLDAATLNARTGSAKPIYDDLGSGPLLARGGFKIGQAPGGRVWIDFLPAGIAEINAKRGGFLAIGLQLGSLRLDDAQDEFVFTNSGGFANFLELTVVPEPSTITLATVSLLAVSITRRRIRPLPAPA